MDPRVSEWRRRLVVVIVVAAVVAPALRDRASFPLSTYPIYAHARARDIVINVAVGVDADGTSRALGLAAIAATDDPLIAQSALDNAVAAGRADELCRLIATRSDDEIAAVEIATEQHDVIARATGRDSLRKRNLLADCVVAP